MDGPPCSESEIMTWNRHLLDDVMTSSLLVYAVSDDVSWLLLVAQSNSGVAAAEVTTVDSGSTSRATDATDEESSSSRRHKHCKQKLELASSVSSLSTAIPPLPRKPNNPYSLYFMLRKKVRICFHCSCLWQQVEFFMLSPARDMLGCTHSTPLWPNYDCDRFGINKQYCFTSAVICTC